MSEKPSYKYQIEKLNDAETVPFSFFYTYFHMFWLWKKQGK